jgi:hypothetical protein
MKLDIFDLKDHLFFFWDVEDTLTNNYPDVGEVSKNKMFRKYKKL